MSNAQRKAVFAKMSSISYMNKFSYMPRLTFNKTKDPLSESISKDIRYMKKLDDESGIDYPYSKPLGVSINSIFKDLEYKRHEDFEKALNEIEDNKLSVGVSLKQLTVPVLPDRLTKIQTEYKDIEPINVDTSKSDYLLWYMDNVPSDDINVDITDVPEKKGDLLAEFGQNLPEKKSLVGSIRIMDEYKDGPLEYIVRTNKKSLDKWDRLLGK